MVIWISPETWIPVLQSALVYKKKGEICIRSGAGIVADSVPEKEFQECRQQSKSSGDLPLRKHRRDWNDRINR